MNPVVVTKVARGAVVAVVALDLVALAALSLRVSSTTTTTVRPIAATTVTVPAAPAPLPGSTAGAFPVGPPPAAVAAALAVPPAAAGPVVTAASTPSSAAPSLRPPVAQPVAASAQQPCPIPLKEPAQAGGLQSLIDFAPAFGQFSAEAFAAASAYQPALQLIGPILAQYPRLAPHIEPALSPLLAQWTKALDSLYALLGPYYTPYRTSVLKAEGNLAAALAPYAEQLADSPLGGCVVDLEAALVKDTK